MDALLADAEASGTPIDGPDGLLAQITKSVLERALDVEIADHLGYEHGDPAGNGSGNSRNGHGRKTVLTTSGPVDLEVPRDRNGTFDPQIVPKRKRRLGQVEDMILSLYARGMSTRDITEHLGEVYGATVSAATISRVTDVVADEIAAWQSRPVDPVYPILYIDAIRLKIRDGGVVANKADNERRETEMWEFMSLGIGEPVPVSALHGRRAGDLLDLVLERFPEHLRQPINKPIDPWRPDDDDDAAAAEQEAKVPRVAIVGRPNVGKSTLFNRLVGEDRSVVHDLAGTTRDSIDTMVETDGGPIVFIDTAGMRRKGRIDDSAEYYSFVRALRSIDNADVALLVIDATVGVTAQDQRLAERVDAAGCPIVLILNKWDLVGTEERLEVQSEVTRMLGFVADSSVLKISALTGKNVDKLHPRLTEAIGQYHTRVPTRDVNKIIAAAQLRQPIGGGAKILYAVQGAIDPPSFTLFVPRDVPQHYLRYIERTIREEFGLGATAIKIRVSKR